MSEGQKQPRRRDPHITNREVIQQVALHVREKREKSNETKGGAYEPREGDRQAGHFLPLRGRRLLQGPKDHEAIVLTHEGETHRPNTREEGGNNNKKWR